MKFLIVQLPPFPRHLIPLKAWVAVNGKSSILSFIYHPSSGSRVEKLRQVQEWTDTHVHTFYGSRAKKVSTEA
jgi:hypothetical protein